VRAIDQDGSGFYQFKGGLIDHATRFVGQSGVERDYVAAGK
jgi:hypothetical protein